MDPKFKYQIQSIPYLESVRSGGLNVIRLSDELRVTRNRNLRIQTDLRYYSVNSIIYPIYDNRLNVFIEKEHYYEVLGGEISLQFFSIDLQQADDVIYVDNAANRTSSDQTFYLNIVMTNDLSFRPLVDKQYLNMETNGGGTAFFTEFIFSNTDNVQLVAKTDAAGVLVVVVYGLYFNAATKVFGRTGFTVINDNAAVNKVLYLNQVDGNLNDFYVFDNSVEPSRTYTFPINDGNIEDSLNNQVTIVD